MIRARAVHACVAVWIVVACAGLASAEDLRVELDDHQRATVVGRGTSTRAVVEELCRKSGALLRYDDQDAEFALAVENEPLEAVLASLLRGKSYLLRFRSDPAGDTRIAELHVLGPEGADRRAEGPAPLASVVPVDLLEAAFASGPPASREVGIQELVRSVGTDPDRRRAFLAMDAATITNALRRFPDAAAVVRKFEGLAGQDAEVKAKLASVLAMLE